MSKPQYLTQDDKGWKLRRPIPKELRELAGKASFVERVGRVSQKSAYEQARVFGVATDLEFETLRSQLVEPKTSNDNQKNAPRFNLSLDRAKVEEIASAYFYEKEEERAKSRSPNANGSRDDYITDAQFDLAVAEEMLGGDDYRSTPSTINATAIHQLIKYGYLSKDDLYEGRVLRLPDEIISLDAFKLLCGFLEQADIELAQRRLFELERGGSAAITNKFFEPMVMKGANPKPYLDSSTRYSLKQLVDAFLAKKKQEVSASRWLQFNIPARALLEHFGEDHSIDGITRDDCDSLVELLPRIPPNVTQRYKKLSIVKAIEKHEKRNGEKTSRVSEGRKKLDVIKAMFELALDKEWLTKNPFERLKIAGDKNNKKKYANLGKGYEAFNPIELNQIFSAPLYTGCKDDQNGFSIEGSNIVRRHRYWVPIIALFSGMRMNEILQLEKTDIVEEENIWCFNITDEEAEDYTTDNFTKQVKNINAIRIVPIHQKLIDFGFLEWVRVRDKGRLFPEARSGLGDKPSIVFSKRFISFLKKIGIWKSRKKVFHSFRNNFNDALRQADVSAELREAINGWEGKHAMDARYGKGYSVTRLHKEINKISYEDLDLKHLEPEEWRKHLIEKRSVS